MNVELSELVMGNAKVMVDEVISQYVEDDIGGIKKDFSFAEGTSKQMELEAANEEISPKVFAKEAKIEYPNLRGRKAKYKKGQKLMVKGRGGKISQAN